MASRPPSSPRHPVPCRGEHCTALVWLKSVLPPAGGKLLRLPLEAAPSPEGTVAARPYATGPGRFLAKGEEPAEGEQRWRNHFDHCPDAAEFRRKAALAGIAADNRQHRRRPPAVREPGEPAQPALFPAHPQETAT